MHLQKIHYAAQRQQGDNPVFKQRAAGVPESRVGKQGQQHHHGGEFEHAKSGYFENKINEVYILGKNNWI